VDRIATILFLSIVLQGTAAVLALRLIPLTGRALAWVLLSLGLLLMMTRRSISLFYREGAIQNEWVHAFTVESVALIISLLMFLGVYYIRAIFERQKQDEEELRKLTRAVEHSPSSTLITNAKGVIEYVNPKFTQITGYTADEAIGRTPRILKSGETPTAIYADLWRTIRAGGEWRGEFRNRKKNGDLYWESASISPVTNADNEITHFVAMQEDITERKEQAAALEFQALHDALTGLPNRSLLYDRLRQAIHNARRRNESFALLMMDLDRFKEVNDTLGHLNGDRMLQQVAQRLAHTLRESDTVARLGGDEFAMLLSNDAGVEVAEKLAQALTPSFDIEGQPVDANASIGIVHFPEHGDDVDTLLQRADVAMYMAKRMHTDYAIYDAQEDVHTLERLTLMTEFRLAVEAEHFVLHYQPQVDLTTGNVIGVETLVRWPHPRKGMVPPDDFIPMAEQSALIKPLTRWVLKTALAECRHWREQGFHLNLAVNLSVRDLEDPQFPEMLAALIEREDVAADCLVLEITENAIMTQPKRSLDIITRLAAMGVRLSIDDFGTGYSSLASLRELPVAELKIDRSFVLGMEQDDNDAIIVRSTIDLAHNLGLRVVAEGIENEALWDLMVILGCDAAQGYHLCYPLPAAQLREWLSRVKPFPATRSAYAKM
jgi:diguanylate cyclase (GGDEF)-like protein/PAS domain S-box-containing protein